jgi:hypothetical protein
MSTTTGKELKQWSRQLETYKNSDVERQQLEEVGGILLLETQNFMLTFTRRY